MPPKMRQYLAGEHLQAGVLAILALALERASSFNRGVARSARRARRAERAE
jgi:hypothetical protein